MSNFNGVNYKEPLKDVIVVDVCPYCNKKFFNKKSYRNHILGGYCIMCDVKTGKSLSEEIAIPLDWFGGGITNE